MPAPFRFASCRVHFQISKSQVRRLLGPSAPEQRADAGQELREREGFYKVVVGTLVESFYSILYCVACRQYQHWSLQSAFSQSGQHLEPVAAGKHKIQKHKIEFLGVDQEESFFSGGRN